MSFARRYLAFLCVLAVFLVPATGSFGGDGGLVNLPGGGSRTAKSTHSASENLILVLPVNMWGATAFVTSYPVGSFVIMPTGPGGMFVLDANVIQQLMASGARKLKIQFVILGAQLAIEIVLNPENNTLTVYTPVP